MIHWLPLHQDTAVAGRAGVELRSRKDWGPTEEGEKRIVRDQTGHLHCNQKY